MNMKEHFKVMLITAALATILGVIAACSNPRITVPRAMNSGFCDTYTMQVIESSDSNNERLRKLSENTYFQGQCS